MPRELFAPPAVSFDVEDWPQSTRDRQLPVRERAAASTRKLLAILDDLGVRATMFVLGKLADAFPELVREIHRAGHEVASHGHGHLEIFHQGRQIFHDETKQARDRLEQLLGVPVNGFRAPDLSIVRESLWALDVLAELGFSYDSSICPARTRRYGIDGWPLEPRRLQLPGGGTLTELPIAAYEVFGRRLPVGGGGYFRLLPGAVARRLAARVMRSRPFVHYGHPYELDHRELDEYRPRLPLSVRLHQGFGRRFTEKRLRRFLGRFGGRPLVELARSRDWPELRPSSGSG